MIRYVRDNRDQKNSCSKLYQKITRGAAGLEYFFNEINKNRPTPGNLLKERTQLHGFFAREKGFTFHGFSYGFLWIFEGYLLLLWIVLKYYCSKSWETLIKSSKDILHHIVDNNVIFIHELFLVINSFYIFEIFPL